MSNSYYTLAELIDSVYGRSGERGRRVNREAPRLRLQDWKVIETLSVGSADYVLLGRTRVDKSAFDSLSARELDAVRRASDGASNKEIAYQMGIRASTVGVLLWRASRKTGAADRDELFRMFASWQQRSTD